MPIYRYQQNQASNLQNLSKVVAINSIMSTAKPALYVDIDAPSQSKSDLDDEMSKLGYVFIATDPISETIVAAQNNSDLILLTNGAVVYSSDGMPVIVEKN